MIDDLKTTKQIVDSFSTINQQLEDLNILLELAIQEKNEAVIQEISQNLIVVGQQLYHFSTKITFTHPDDFRNVFLTVQSGTGGTDACDWAYMLFRMYEHYAARKNFKIEILYYQSEQEGGIKNATLHIKGEWAYGYLKSEHGVHRLVRISPFDASGRRHTSFAAVDITPEPDEESEIEILDKDLRIDCYRSSGAGGQHVNVTESAIRITHIPTGIVVCVQNERSQHKNRAVAMKILQSRLLQKRRQQQANAITEDYNSKGQVSWSNQIRSYVLHPYSLVKDHRTNYETGNTQAVLNGELDALIEAYLAQKEEPKRK